MNLKFFEYIWMIKLNFDDFSVFREEMGVCWLKFCELVDSENMQYSSCVTSIRSEQRQAKKQLWIINNQLEKAKTFQAKNTIIGKINLRHTIDQE